jgi:hypothetical protein
MKHASVSSLMGPKMNARQQRHGKQHNGAKNKRQAAASRRRSGQHPKDHPGSPRLTSAAPDRGERRRPMLTRQNRKGNVQSTSPKFCPPLPCPCSRLASSEMSVTSIIQHCLWASILENCAHRSTNHHHQYHHDLHPISTSDSKRAVAFVR